jgi:hypothetical protein
MPSRGSRILLLFRALSFSNETCEGTNEAVPGLLSRCSSSDAALDGRAEVDA